MVLTWRQRLSTRSSPCCDFSRLARCLGVVSLVGPVGRVKSSDMCAHRLSTCNIADVLQAWCRAWGCTVRIGEGARVICRVHFGSGMRPGCALRSGSPGPLPGACAAAARVLMPWRPGYRQTARFESPISMQMRLGAGEGPWPCHRRMCRLRAHQRRAQARWDSCVCTTSIWIY